MAVIWIDVEQRPRCVGIWFYLLVAAYSPFALNRYAILECNYSSVGRRHTKNKLYDVDIEFTGLNLHSLTKSIFALTIKMNTGRNRKSQILDTLFV